MKTLLFILGLIALVACEDGVDPEAGLPAVKLLMLDINETLDSFSQISSDTGDTLWKNIVSQLRMDIS